MKYLFTVDIECLSFSSYSYDDKTAISVMQTGLPRLLDLLKKYHIKATFFTTANYCRLAPESIRQLHKQGHEIGCHGFDHSDYYDELSESDQYRILTDSKNIIEGVIEDRVISFRAPALRINNNTVSVLERLGFLIDSSVASQRFDGPFTSGAIKKLGWLSACRKPYFMSYQNYMKSGGSGIFEIPVSALLWPYVGTHLRISPGFTSQVERVLCVETKMTDKPIVFLIHPNEFIEFDKEKTVRRGSYFSDILRHKIKMKNLGLSSVDLLDQSLKRFKKRGFEFLTLCEYYDQSIN